MLTKPMTPWLLNELWIKLSEYKSSEVRIKIENIRR